MNLVFQNAKHEQAYQVFLEEAYLTEGELREPSQLLRRQLAFLYLVALFQEEYMHYEGENFFIEAYEDLSLGGPTYLLEDDIGEGRFPHEKILSVAKSILKGEGLCIPEGLEEFIRVIDCALRVAN